MEIQKPQNLLHQGLFDEWEKNRSNAKKLAESIFEEKGLHSASMDQMAGKAHQNIFEVIDCMSCANCCKTTPPIILPADIKKIGSFLKISPNQFRMKFTLTDVDGEMSFKKVPCVFLGENNLCQIYEVRPAACREYPHTDAPGFRHKKKLHL
ncbi:MAG TPA: YkgJ family cysteine cluster protein, partial [Saprospiraceae bacterium]|nr:YkgJ family cysteine cluster protein [Saprospiraceae bacterium]